MNERFYGIWNSPSSSEWGGFSTRKSTAMAASAPGRHDSNSKISWPVSPVTQSSLTLGLVAEPSIDISLSETLYIWTVASVALMDRQSLNLPSWWNWISNPPWGSIHSTRPSLHVVCTLCIPLSLPMPLEKSYKIIKSQHVSIQYNQQKYKWLFPNLNDESEWGSIT